MIDCLKGLVDLGDTCGITPSPGAVQLQTLGIDETFLAAITGPEGGPAKMLRQVEEWARLYMAGDVLRRMGPSAQGHSVLSRQLVGDPADGSAPASPTGSVGGVVVEVDPGRSNFTLAILTVTYAGTLAGGETLTIYDLSDGTSVYSAPLAAVQPINLDLPAHRRKVRYFIAHDAAGYGNTIFGGSCCGHKYTHGGVAAYGGQIGAGVPPVAANVQEVQHGRGLSALISVGCDHAQLLCEMRFQMQMPYLYKIAQGIMDRAMQAVDRWNNVTLDKDLLARRAAQYEAEYQQQMQTVMNALQVPCSDPCFRCGRRVVSAVNLPS